MYSGFLLILGFLLLFFGGELLVRGSVGIALKLRVSVLVVGMTIVSFATSSPELFVCLQALFNDNTNIALGNVIGSNIANIALVLGLTALIFGVRISKQTLGLNYPVMLLSSITLGLAFYLFSGVNQIIGLLFVLFLVFFSYFLIKKSRLDEIEATVSEDEILGSATNYSIKKSVLFIFSGIILLKYGADNLVNGTILIANNLNISDRVIAVTVVAIGTSIPELATSIIAAFKKQDGLIVGNLIGSNIFNILAVLGISSIVKSIQITDQAIFSFDYLWMISIAILLGIFIYFLSNRKITRLEGAILIVAYIIYIYYSLN